MVQISKTDYSVFGKCLQIDNGLCRLVCSLDFGPRILYFSLAGKENIFHNDVGKAPLGDEYPVFGGDRFVLYGGHRIWISPEIMPRCYHPDNKSVTFEQTPHGAVVRGAVEVHTQIQKIMHISMHPDKPVVNIKHEIKNTGLWEIECAPWCITMTAQGGIEAIPQAQTKTGYLPNRNFSLWDYSDITDERVIWGREFILIRQDKTISRAFKVGLNNAAGYAALFNREQLFLRYFDYDAEALYPDSDCSYESYVNGAMLEMEVLGPLQIIEPGGAACSEESWEIYESAKPAFDEASVKAALEALLE